MIPVWMTSSDLFKVMIIQRQITWNWYNIQLGLYLQWPTNRKWYDLSSCAIMAFSLTLNDPYPQFQGRAILWLWMSHKQYDIQTQFRGNTNRDLNTPYSTVSFRMTLSDLEWLKQNIQWHKASSGLSATAELLVLTLSLLGIPWVFAWTVCIVYAAGFL